MKRQLDTTREPIKALCYIHPGGEFLETLGSRVTRRDVVCCCLQVVAAAVFLIPVIKIVGDIYVTVVVVVVVYLFILLLFNVTTLHLQYDF